MYTYNPFIAGDQVQCVDATESDVRQLLRGVDRVIVDGATQPGNGLATIDKSQQDSIEGWIVETALGLIRLAGPEVGARRLGDDVLGHTKVRSEQPYLALVEIADLLRVRAGRGS